MKPNSKGVARVVILALALSGLIPGPAPGETPAFQEYQVKAAFLYNFAKFVEWPSEAFASPESPMVLVILGSNPFGDALKNLRGKTVNGRQLVVRMAESVEDVDPSHILYVGESEKGKLSHILKTAEKRNILTVGDSEGFAQRGGVINMLTEGSRVVIEVNPEAAQRARLTVSSKLLALARIVRAGRR